MKTKISWLSFFSIILIVALGMLQIYLANTLATKGRQLTEQEKKIAEIEKDNQELRTEIASLGKISELPSVAQEKGFLENPKVVNLTGKIPVALNP